MEADNCGTGHNMQAEQDKGNGVKKLSAQIKELLEGYHPDDPSEQANVLYNLMLLEFQGITLELKKPLVEEVEDVRNNLLTFQGLSKVHSITATDVDVVCFAADCSNGDVPQDRTIQHLMGGEE